MLKHRYSISEKEDWILKSMLVAVWRWICKKQRCISLHGIYQKSNLSVLEIESLSWKFVCSQLYLVCQLTKAGRNLEQRGLVWVGKSLGKTFKLSERWGLQILNTDATEFMLYKSCSDTVL